MSKLLITGSEELKGQIDIGIVTMREDEASSILERFKFDRVAKGSRLFDIAQISWRDKGVRPLRSFTDPIYSWRRYTGFQKESMDRSVIPSLVEWATHRCSEEACARGGMADQELMKIGVASCNDISDIFPDLVVSPTYRS